MAVPTTYPSGFTTGINGTDRTLVEPFESIGRPTDDAATAISSTDSAFSLLKGMARDLGVPSGSGIGVTNTAPQVYPDLLETLGDVSDAAATDTGRNSAISLAKGICALAGL